MTPEEKARVKIDQMFEDAGWQVVDRDFYSPTITAAAIREGLLEGNREADYFLFLNGMAVGVLEAKRKEVNVASDVVCEQAIRYTRYVPADRYRAIASLLPFIFVSNGEETYFRDCRDEESNLEPINRIYTPKEMVKLLGIEDPYAGLPTLSKKGLRDCQYEAISELEGSFRAGQNRALLVLATGAGKTYTACMAAYRFLAYTPMKRILFLVDRNNLGKQAEGEFGMFRLTENGDPFNTIFTVNRLKSNKVPSDSNVVISTIQRLFSLLSGKEITDDDDDDDPATGEVELPGNIQLPPDFFDVIIIDECHRSIYGDWRKVLEYFNTAKMIGLTATPVPETLAFFNKNLVVNYTLERSIVDGVNVDGRIFRIKTEATENGGAILKGQKLKRVTKYTGEVEDIKNEETKNYTREELNRSVINPAQIKLVLETYRDAVYTEMFTDPQREPIMDYLPKTLIFALNENHATNIVKIAKEVFGRTDDKFVQKITYSSGDSNELIRQFRNDKEFRIAVTCTLVATGTDVKPLEVVMFMRDVASEPLYIQMKGRGVRTIGDDQLRNVTPNAFSKDCYFLVDAVGVTESHKTVPGGGNGPQGPTITLRRLLELLTHGNVSDENLLTLAARLPRIDKKCNDKQREHFQELAHTSIKEISSNIYEAYQRGLEVYKDINDPNLERKTLVAPLTHHPEARHFLLILAAGFVETLQPGEDTLISKGFSQEEAKDLTSAFEKYCEDHQDEIEALRMIYNNEGEPLTYYILKDLENKLKMANNKFQSSRIWNSYAIVNPQSVKRYTTKEEKEALTNIIQLVRFANHQIEKLESLYPQAQQRFNLWYGQMQRTVTESQIAIIRQIVDYIASNGACTIKDIIDDDKTRAAQLINAFGGKQQADEALVSLSKFLLYRKTA